MSKNAMAARKGYLYFSNRRFLVVESNGAGQWNWRYFNGNGNTISEGVGGEGAISAETITDALAAAAEAAGIAEHLYA